MKKQAAFGILSGVALIALTGCIEVKVTTEDQELREATRTRFNEIWEYQVLLRGQIIDLRKTVATNAQVPDGQEQGPPGQDPKEPADSLPSNWP